MTGLQLGDFAAAIFDLDGTVTDNMALHHRALGALAAHYRLDHVTDELIFSTGGLRNSDIFPLFFQRDLSPEEQLRYADEKEQHYRKLAAGALKPVAGLRRLLDELRRRGIPTAIATSAPAENVSFSLTELELEGAFATVVLGSEVANGKPAPDIFLEAARRLGVAPGRCIGFEDSRAGIESIAAAGMYCVALTTALTLQELRAHDTANLIVDDFDSFLDGV